MATPEFLSGGGEMGALIRNYDWAGTALGPIDQWPQSLRTCIRIMLTSRQPIWIGWGKNLIKFYNDPYKAIVGGKHPWALGKPASVVWKDIWRDIEPMLKQVMEKDEGTYVESQMLIMERNGYPEETYYTFSYTPIPGDDGKTEGMFCANSDDTEKIIIERQLRTLTLLGKSLADCRSNTDIIEKTIATLHDNPHDFPFVLFRTIENGKAFLMHSTPLGEAASLIPKEIDLFSSYPISDCINKALETRKIQLFKGLRKTLGSLPKGAWEVSPDDAIVLPIVQAGMKELYSILVIGLNPYRLFDEKYKSFFSLVSDQIATSFSDVHQLEEERKRAEALAEIDKAKTMFFSNISHEFRTPLTLLLGPIEESLNDPSTIEENKIRLEVAHRNALRMQRLVNTLLEFSRIEAGRLDGKFSRVDICAITQELASTFRSAIEKAGMQLIFDCKADSEVYVDTDMWEKIVLNLVSNAFKYSHEGTITIKIREHQGLVHISVSDTGVGIPADQLDKIFDRFHRIENMEGRSQEGTGIGLAMVKELVKLHQGTIMVSSEPGKGSTFTVSLPTGKNHLPTEKVVDGNNISGSSAYANAVIQEAMKWIPDNGNMEMDNYTKENLHDIMAQSAGTIKYKVVLADDNADMREYVERLLKTQFAVITASDGEDAFHKVIQYNPDLLITDIMMPKLDGFGLIRKIRNHPDKKSLPVVFLSARAGDEAKIEGLQAGADDYLVKPFSAKELLARVEANIKIARSRIAAENNLRNVILQSPVATTLLRGPSFIVEIVNQKSLEIWDKNYEDVINQPLLQVMPEIIMQGFDKILVDVYNTGKPFHANEFPTEFVRSGKMETLYLNFIFQAMRNEEGLITGIIGVGIDVTEQVQSRRKIEQSQKELNEMANAVPQLVWVADPTGYVTYYNERISEFDGAARRDDGTWFWEGILHPDDMEFTKTAWENALGSGELYQVEHRVKLKDGSYRWYLSRGLPHKDDHGNIIKWFGSATDIHIAREQSQILEEEVKKRTRELYEVNLSLQQSNNELQQFAHVASHDLKEPLRKVKTFAGKIAEDNENLLSEKSKIYFQKVNSAADRMSAMIDGVLNYSTINTTEQKIEPVSLEMILKNIEQDLEILISEKQATIEYDQLPTIEGSAVLLYQLFYNLLNNSLKFSKQHTPPVIRITSRKNEEYTDILIEDNGIGFEKVYAEKIFESFARLHSRDRFEGTGLGLSLCKRIAERHGGTITASGIPDQGAFFTIHLPLKQNRSSI